MGAVKPTVGTGSAYSWMLGEAVSADRVEVDIVVDEEWVEAEGGLSALIALTMANVRLDIPLNRPFPTPPCLRWLALSEREPDWSRIFKLRFVLRL